MSDERPISGGASEPRDPFSRPPSFSPPPPASMPPASMPPAYTPPPQSMTPFSSPLGPAAPPEITTAPSEVQVTAGGPTGSGGRRRSPGLVVGAIVGVLVLIAAGVFAITKIRDNGSSGGAASPTEVGQAWFRAMEDEDLLAAMDLLLPSEQDTFREPFLQTLDNLKRLEILDNAASADSIGGVDIHIEDPTVEETPTNVDDIAHIRMTGTSSVTVDGDKVPLGSFLLDEVFDGKRPEMNSSSDSGAFDQTFTVVRRDGRWYLSLMYSIAEVARGDSDIPEQGVEPLGASSPEGAVTDFLDRVAGLDLTGMLQLLDPTEAEALLRYAPLFLPDAEAQLADVPVSIEISDAVAKASGSGSRRGVSLQSLTVAVTDKGSGETQTFKYADGCLSGKMFGDQPVCATNGQPASESLPKLFERFDVGDPERARALADTLASAFDDYDATGISVHQVGGRWYISPLRSYYEVFNDALTALDAGELRDIADAVRAFSDSVDMGGTMDDIEQQIGG